jgi:hypothetical protein
MSDVLAWSEGKARDSASRHHLPGVKSTDHRRTIDFIAAIRPIADTAMPVRGQISASEGSDAGYLCSTRQQRLLLESRSSPQCKLVTENGPSKWTNHNGAGSFSSCVNESKI